MKSEIVLRAEKETIAIMSWAKSCETPEQFENIERFSNNHKFLINKLYETDIQYYIGALHGFVLSLRKTKFGEPK